METSYWSLIFLIVKNSNRRIIFTRTTPNKFIVSSQQISSNVLCILETYYSFENSMQYILNTHWLPPDSPSHVFPPKFEMSFFFLLFTAGSILYHPTSLGSGACPGVWSMHQGHLLRENWLCLAQQLRSADTSLAGGGTSFLPFLFCAWNLSGLNLSRPCTCCQNSYEFIWVSAIIVLKNAVFWSTAPGSCSLSGPSGLRCVWKDHLGLSTPESVIFCVLTSWVGNLW